MLKEIYNKYVKIIMVIFLIPISFIAFSYYLEILNSLGRIIGSYLSTL